MDRFDGRGLEWRVGLGSKGSIDGVFASCIVRETERTVAPSLGSYTERC